LNFQDFQLLILILFDEDPWGLGYCRPKFRKKNFFAANLVAPPLI
jgi:hypothetical protein